jgi:hypothetical protein
MRLAHHVLLFNRRTGSPNPLKCPVFQRVIAKPPKSKYTNAEWVSDAYSACILAETSRLAGKTVEKT